MPLEPGSAVRTCEPGPQDRDEQQVEKTVEHRFLAGLVLDDLAVQGPPYGPPRT
jgi:hypothetical protein